MGKISKTLVKIGTGFLVGVAVDCGTRIIEDLKNDKLLQEKTAEDLIEVYVEKVNEFREREIKSLSDRINNLSNHEYGIIQKYILGKEDELKEEGKRYIEFKIDEFLDIINSFGIAIIALYESMNDGLKRKKLCALLYRDMIESVEEASKDFDMEITDILVWKATMMTCEENYTTIIIKDDGKDVKYRMPELLACRTPLEQYYIKRIKYLESLLERPHIAREIWKSKSVAAGLLNEMEMGYIEKVGINSEENADKHIEAFVEAYKESDKLIEQAI